MINENLRRESLRQITRRYFFKECWSSVGAIALTSLLNESLFADLVDPMAPKKSHFPAKAKRVLFMGMSCGPSQIDLFDYKPKLKELHGKSIRKTFVRDHSYALINRDYQL